MTHTTTFKKSGNGYAATKALPSPFVSNMPLYVTAKERPSSKNLVYVQLSGQVDSHVFLEVNGVRLRSFEPIPGQSMWYSTSVNAEEYYELLGLEQPTPPTTMEPDSSVSLITQANRMYNNYRSVKFAGGFVDNVMFRFYRQHRNYKNNFNRSIKGKIENEMSLSKIDLENKLASYDLFVTWTEENVKPLVVAQNDPNLLKKYNCVMEGPEPYVEFVRERIEDYEDEDYFNLIYDEVTEVAESLGLERYEPFAPGEDGAVWFVDPDTGQKYFAGMKGLYSVNSTYSILSEFREDTLNYPNGKWKNYPHINLLRTVMKPTYAKTFPNITYLIGKSGFLREVGKYFKQAHDENPAPWTGWMNSHLYSAS